ncbi:TetR/AcrR family transcriptional regulator [Nocardia sp. NPDC051570]|uniref:TetR/AcrR family transcriptional regulator n=1 Tax=Nocardia sp. NPDC051570 TaxID=3364324 RepID=UPI003788C28C
MAPRRRLTPEQRREQLLDVGTQLFAARPYADVLMEDVAARAGVSRALLYRHFPNKADLFAAIWRQRADRLLTTTALDSATPLREYLSVALDTHLDYYAANKLTTLAANRELSGDPAVQAVTSDLFVVLRQRILDAPELADHRRELVSAVVMGWLVFVRILCMQWLENETFSRTALRDTCVNALLGGLGLPGFIGEP